MAVRFQAKSSPLGEGDREAVERGRPPPTVSPDYSNTPLPLVISA